MDENWKSLRVQSEVRAYEIPTPLGLLGYRWASNMMWLSQTLPSMITVAWTGDCLVALYQLTENF
jgi:hypothetical protein